MLILDKTGNSDLKMKRKIAEKFSLDNLILIGLSVFLIVVFVVKVCVGVSGSKTLLFCKNVNMDGLELTHASNKEEAHST